LRRSRPAGRRWQRPRKIITAVGRELLGFIWAIVIRAEATALQAAARASTKKNPRLPYATGSAGFATLVRGSSRWIMTMRFRPANIRLINRRQNLQWLLLALFLKNDKAKTTPFDVQG
jgi:hypothetical protein